MALPIDEAFLKEFLVGLLNVPSPTGFAEKAIAYTEQALKAWPLQLRHTNKGTLIAEWAGRSNTAPRALTAHVDTLGAMVKEIKENGRLKLSKIGGYSWTSVETEGCDVFTAAGPVVRGALLVIKPSGHVFGAEVTETHRSDDNNMEVRLDARTASQEETLALGVRVGDFVVFDRRVETGPAGFVRSRHLDDKACVACVVTAIKALQEAGRQPAQRTTFHFSNYEEVGHGGASGFPPDLVELLTVDMAAVGMGQTSDEYHVTICVKDTGGPYHIDMTRKLTRLAEAAQIPYKIDIYPNYSSDGEAYWKAGGDVRVGLIGPGVEASHSYERTHLEALVRTTQLIIEYLLND